MEVLSGRSRLLCRDFQKGWLFEPNPVAAAAASRNLALNGVGERFQVIEAAVGERNGTVGFPVLMTPGPAAHIGTSGVGGESVDVRMVRLDDFLPPAGNYVVKIDVEGFDANVVAGLKDGLSAKRVKICLFECLTDKVLAKVLGIVQPLGYVVMDGERTLSRPGGERNRDLFIVQADLLERYRQARARARAAVNG